MSIEAENCSSLSFVVGRTQGTIAFSIRCNNATLASCGPRRLRDLDVDLMRMKLNLAGRKLIWQNYIVSTHQYRCLHINFHDLRQLVVSYRIVTPINYQHWSYTIDDVIIYSLNYSFT